MAKSNKLEVQYESLIERLNKLKRMSGKFYHIKLYKLMSVCRRMTSYYLHKYINFFLQNVEVIIFQDFGSKV